MGRSEVMFKAGGRLRLEPKWLNPAELRALSRISQLLEHSAQWDLGVRRSYKHPLSPKPFPGSPAPPRTSGPSEFFPHPCRPCLYRAVLTHRAQGQGSGPAQLSPPECGQLISQSLVKTNAALSKAFFSSPPWALFLAASRV